MCLVESALMQSMHASFEMEISMKNILIILINLTNVSNQTFASDSHEDLEAQNTLSSNKMISSKELKYSCITFSVIASGVGINFIADHFASQDLLQSSVRVPSIICKSVFNCIIESFYATQ